MSETEQKIKENDQDLKDEPKVTCFRLRQDRTYSVLKRMKPVGMSWDLFFFNLATGKFHRDNPNI